MFFHGTHTMTLDDKGRMRVPNKLKAKLEGDYCIFMGSDEFLYLVSEKVYADIFHQKALEIPLHDEEKQMALRIISAATQNPEEDGQGRFILDGKLKDHAKIKKKVVFVGISNRIEIWSEEKYNEKFLGTPPNIAAALKTLGV